MPNFRAQDRKWRRLPVDLICALRDLIFTVFYRVESGATLEGLGDRVMLWSQTKAFSKLPDYLQAPTQALVFSLEQQAPHLPMCVDPDSALQDWRERQTAWEPVMQASCYVFSGCQQLLNEADAYLETAKIRTDILQQLVEERMLFPADLARTTHIVRADLARMRAAQANIRALLECNNSRPSLF